MTQFLGDFSLSLAVLAAALSFAASIAAGRLGSAGALRVARWSLGALALLLTVASACLLTAELRSDFRIDYVAHYTERALPVGYKIAAFWAGQEGSLLLWAWMLGIMAAVVALRQRRETGVEPAGTLAALAGVTGFFAALMLFAANPFASTGPTPLDGRGLNPMLQDPAMIAHPPLLFVGYAGFTVPFAMLVGALVAGRADGQWIARVRRWTLFSWLFLTAGILLGAQWAYVELGWGGYWAWDPVENASLLPWLTGTAYLHSIMAQQRRNTLKVWSASLVALTFILCIFGTYLTRSGLVDSVHGFGASLVGTFFLVFLITLVLFSVALIVWRLPRLRSAQTLEGLMTREGAFLATNVVLLIMMIFTLVGTIFPVISRVVIQKPISVGQPFYNSVVVPMGMLLVALMALGPALVWGRQPMGQLLRRLAPPAAAGLVVVIALAAMGIWNAWALACGLICGGVAAAIAADIVRGLHHRLANTHENPVVGLVRLLDADHRRYGGYLTHLGVVMVVAGIAGSSLFSVDRKLQLAPNGSEVVVGYRVRLDSLAPVQGPNYQAVEAKLTVTDPAGNVSVLRPQRRVYNKSENPNSHVAIDSSWKQDFYVTLAGWENNGQIVAIEAIINPLVSWIWIGGIVASLGVMICLMPRLLVFSAHGSHVVVGGPSAHGADAAAPVAPLAPAARASGVEPAGQAVVTGK